MAGHERMQKDGDNFLVDRVEALTPRRDELRANVDAGTATPLECRELDALEV